MYTTRSRGFTLIELLVVIAIIGILSAVVLASLNTARSKGNDAAVKANLGTVGTQAALYLAENSNSYGVFDVGSVVANCPAPGAAGTSLFHDATVARAIAAALANAAGGVAKCVSSATTYAVAVTRPDTTNSAYWCVDSLGSRCGINTLISGAATSCGACVPGE